MTGSHWGGGYVSLRVDSEPLSSFWLQGMHQTNQATVPVFHWTQILIHCTNTCTHGTNMCTQLRLYNYRMMAWQCFECAT